MAQEGGSLIRPLFLDFGTKGFTSELMENESQFMVGSNIMIFINQKSVSNQTQEFKNQNIINDHMDNYNFNDNLNDNFKDNLNDNFNDVQKNENRNIKFNSETSIFFPSVYFYDFFTGEILNKNGSGVYNVTTLKLNSGLNVFLRGGLITPVQNFEMINSIYSNLIDNKFDLSDFPKYNQGESLIYQKFLNFIPDLTMMKNRPIELILALDSNLRATGRILFDDGYSSDTQNKKLYYKMEIVAANVNDNFVLSFHVNSYKYKPKESEYPYIQDIVLYGYTRLSVKKISLISKLKRLDLARTQYKFDKEVLKIKNLNIRMDIDNKLIIS